MSDITIRKVTYRELKKKPIEVKDDRYGIAAFYTESVRQTFLACPGNREESDCALLLLLDDDIVIGREIWFGIRLKIGDKILWVHAGCCLMVCEEYRKVGAGIELMTANIYKDDSVSFSAFYTPMRVKLFKKQKRAIFEIPEFIKLNNTRFLFESLLGVKGCVLKLFTVLGNVALRVMEIPNMIKRKKLLMKYVVKKESTVPDWAGEMAINDGHKYMEYHDTKWLQWNLDYNLNQYPEDIQSFYSIFDKKGLPVGFFMIKERLERVAGRYKNVIRGTIVEWATSDKNLLTEADINLLALSFFSRHTSHITSISDNDITIVKLKQMGFRKHGTFQMNFRDKTGEYADGANMANWRIRYGCSNSIIY